MRKSVKLAAASTLAAFAMLGASTTAASAWGGDDHNVNVCGNGGGSPLVWAGDGNATTGDVSVTGVSHQVVCQNGEFNHAHVSHDGYVAGGGGAGGGGGGGLTSIVANVTAIVG